MKKLIDSLGQGPFQNSAHGEVQKLIFISTFALIARLVSTDGDMDKKELILIDQLMRQTMKLDEEKRKFANKIFNESRKIEVPTKDYISAYKKALADKPKMYEWLLDVLVRLSFADEVLKPEEESLLLEVCTGFGFDKTKLTQIQSRYRISSPLAESYEALGLSEESDFSMVQNAYDKLMSMYDSEKLIELGFAHDLVEIAMNKQADYTAAFLQIKKAEGK